MKRRRCSKYGVRSPAPLRSRLSYGAARVSKRSSLRSRLCFVLALSAPSLLAQSPADPLASLNLRASRNYVAVGAAITLRATGSTVLGGVVFNPQPVWRSLAPSIAHADENGRVTGLFPGTAPIEATVDGVVTTLSIRVLPGRIEMQPRLLDIDNGQSGTLRAVAYDVTGRPIPGVRYRWSSAFPGVATVDHNGLVTARSEGYTSVTAHIDAGPGYNVSVQGQVGVRLRPSWRIAQLVSNETITRPVTLRNITLAAYGGGDRMAAIGVLSNGSQAILSYENGVWRVLLTAGQPIDSPSGAVNTIENIAVNTRGEVLASVNRWTDNPGVLLLFRGGAMSIVPHGFSNTTTCCYNNLDIPSRSFPDNGDVLFTAQTPQGVQIVLRKSNGTRQIVTSGSDNLPGFGPYDWVSFLSYSGGRLLFWVNKPNRQAVFDWDGQRFRKLFAQNEPLLGRNVWYWDGPVMTASGDVYARIAGDNFNGIFRHSANAWTTIVPKDQREPDEINPWGVHWLTDASNDGPMWVGDSEQGYGLFRIRGGRVEFVARGGTNPGDWAMFRQAFLRTQGDVLVLGSQQGAASRLAVVGPGGVAPSLDSGRAFDIAAPLALDWRNLGGNTIAGAPVVRSTGGLMMRVNKGSVQPAIAPGDTVAGSQLTTLDSVAVSSNGDLLFSASTTQGYTLYTQRGGRASLLLRDGTRARLTTGGDLQLNCCFNHPMAMNNRGQAVVSTNWSNSTGGLLFVDAIGAVRPVIQRNQALPGGGVFNNANQAAIDESGRILFYAQLADGQGLYLWDDGQLRRILKTGEPTPFGRVFNNLGPLLAAGDKFYVHIHHNEDPNVIASYDGARWQRLAATGDLILGSRVNGFLSNRFAVASNGDIAIMPWLPDVAVVVRRADGTYRIVARGGDRTSEGDWLSGNFYDIALTDSGDVFFTADIAGALQPRIALVQATPN